MARHISAGPFANEGERRVVAALKNALPPNACVISNLYLPNRNDTLEIDALVLSAYGAVVIETKDWRGEVAFDSTSCSRDGQRCDDPRSTTSFKAKVLHSRLKPWDIATVPLIVLASEPARLTLDRAGSVPVKRIEEAISAVRTGQVFRDRVRSPLSDGELDEIVQDLVGAHDRHHARRLGPYLVGASTGGDDDDLWATEIAQPAHRVRLKRYTIDGLASPRDRDEQHRAAIRAFEALRHLESKRLRSLPIVYTCFVDQDDDATIWMAYEGVVGDSLLDAPLEARDKVLALASAAETLARCHAGGVIHRSLSPDCLIVPAGEKVPIILHFDFARLGGAPTIARGRAGREIRNLTRAAPEIRENPARTSEAADIYALGITAVEVLSGARMKTYDEARQAAKRLRPRELPPVLLQAIAEEPARRTKSMQDLADALRRAVRG